MRSAIFANMPACAIHHPIRYLGPRGTVQPHLVLERIEKNIPTHIRHYTASAGSPEIATVLQTFASVLYVGVFPFGQTRRRSHLSFLTASSVRDKAAQRFRSGRGGLEKVGPCATIQRRAARCGARHALSPRGRRLPPTATLRNYALPRLRTRRARAGPRSRRC